MSKLKAAIFDLDGVVTLTATTHAKAWKKMFDAYNEQRKKDGKEPYDEFSIEKDYLEYLDGIPRYDGVANFLESRGIDLPKGTPDDEPKKETVCGLGNWKNEIFQGLLQEADVEVFEENVKVIREWKESGIKTAIISSSKNCKMILEAVGLEDLFEVRIDGVVSEERNLKGKPAPDIFLEAAKELNVIPAEALIVEDALAGVEAGSKGNFQLVIGIGTKTKEMLERGADQVMENLTQVELEQPLGNMFHHLPSALENFEKIAQKIHDKPVILCLDYDGTLTPIVEQYDQAIISDEMRDQVREITKKIPVAIVSGRDIKFIEKHVQLEGVFYAGSHGFEIDGPDDFHYELDEAEELLPVLDQWEEDLESDFRASKGVEIERKKYAIAVHYRNAADDVVPKVRTKIDELLAKDKRLKAGKGKMVIEIRPDIAWDKGKAVELICDQINTDDKKSVAIYVGDDITDEDAFEVIKRGVGILVGSHEERTSADYQLEDVPEVARFLKMISDKV